MKLPLEITFRNMQPSDAVQAAVRERAAKLDKFYRYIMACHVTVNAPHKHHHKGNRYQVKIDVTVPGGELVVSHNADANKAHEDVYVAMRDAFDAIRRRLEDYARKRRGHIKSDTFSRTRGSAVARRRLRHHPDPRRSGGLFP